MIATVVKDYKTVIMDGSNKAVVDNIIEAMGIFINDGPITCQPLDERHPTMMVVDVKTDECAYRATKAIIEKLYPGLCVFDLQI